jgi:hypothetical protein
MSRLSIRIRLKFPVIVIEAFWVIPDIYIRGAMHLSVGRARRAVIVRHAGKSVYSPISVPVRNHGVVENSQPCRVCNLFAHAESFNKTQTRNSHQLRLSPNTIHEPRDTNHEQRVTIHRQAFLLWKPNFGFGLSSSAAIAESISNTA